MWVNSALASTHHSALRDRQLAAVLNGTGVESPEDVLIQAISSTSSCDTPANRTLLALLKRFRARAMYLRAKVSAQALGGPKDEQVKRSPRRVEVLDHLISQTLLLTQGQTLRQVSGHGPSASGLTQIAALPGYQRAYRMGCAALMTGIEGSNPLDQLHSNFSWGIYETWCYVQVLAIVPRLLENCTPIAHSSAVGAQLSYRFSLPNSRSIDVLFQARFPSEQAETNPLARSISRERYPDILLVDSVGLGKRSMVLDAKWRSGRKNVLEAMESAHIYHDSLRLGGTPPTPCLLLLPGDTCVPSLETDQFIEQHGVGSISGFSAQGAGLDRLERRIEQWLNAGG
ncbi:nuclease domain-containing protein [Pseudomonas sp. KB_15]|uniref:nuclease domain-containing protein n=1 Tax=Pseudomonas sp. KB_15 TaxID=3233035 RepID=UPI003F9486AA